MILHPLGHEQITDMSSAVGLTVPAGATRCLLTATTQAVRFRDDGTDPTASVGIHLAAGDPPYMYQGDLTAIKFIEEATSAVLDVSYYG